MRTLVAGYGFAMAAACDRVARMLERKMAARERRRRLNELYAVAVRVDHHAGCEEGSECLGVALHELSDALARVPQ
jgi:hypothetical protein